MSQASGFKLIKSSPAERCEVCHQADGLYLNSSDIQMCGRCQDIRPPLEPLPSMREFIGPREQAIAFGHAYDRQALLAWAEWAHEQMQIDTRIQSNLRKDLAEHDAAYWRLSAYSAVITFLLLATLAAWILSKPTQ